MKNTLFVSGMVFAAALGATAFGGEIRSEHPCVHGAVKKALVQATWDLVKDATTGQLEQAFTLEAFSQFSTSFERYEPQKAHYVVTVDTFRDRRESVRYDVHVEEARDGKSCRVLGIAPYLDQKTTFSCTEASYPTSYPLTVEVTGYRAVGYPRSYAGVAEPVTFSLTSLVTEAGRTVARGDGFEFRALEGQAVLKAPRLHGGESVRLNCRRKE